MTLTRITNLLSLWIEFFDFRGIIIDKRMNNPFVLYLAFEEFLHFAHSIGQYDFQLFILKLKQFHSFMPMST